jgi:hypothetical protein
MYQSMRTTITMDDDVFEAAQAQARASGKNLGVVISQLARRGLRASADTASKNGLPVFKVQANAAVISSNRVKELLDEEAS